VQQFHLKAWIEAEGIDDALYRLGQHLIAVAAQGVDAPGVLDGTAEIEVHPVAACTTTHGC
jgi:hypothetical protein